MTYYMVLHIPTGEFLVNYVTYGHDSISAKNRLPSEPTPALRWSKSVVAKYKTRGYAEAAIRDRCFYESYHIPEYEVVEYNEAIIIS